VEHSVNNSIASVGVRVANYLKEFVLHAAPYFRQFLLEKQGNLIISDSAVGIIPLDGQGA
jgi:hypothetical protein